MGGVVITARVSDKTYAKLKDIAKRTGSMNYVAGDIINQYYDGKNKTEEKQNEN